MNGAHVGMGRGCWWQVKGVGVMSQGEIILPPSIVGLEQFQLPHSFFLILCLLIGRIFLWENGGGVAKRELEMVCDFFQSSNWLSPPYISFSNGTENLIKVPCSNACPMTPFCHRVLFLTPTHKNTSITEVGTCVHVCICLKKKIYTFTISDDTG